MKRIILPTSERSVERPSIVRLARNPNFRPTKPPIRLCVIEEDESVAKARGVVLQSGNGSVH